MDNATQTQTQKDLKAALIKSFGTRIEKDYDEIYSCISATICARVYAGNVGDNPLCILNRALETIIKK